LPLPADSDMANCAVNVITVMGYTMRTSSLRYTEWVGFRCAPSGNPEKKPETRIASEADWSDVHAVELYLHNSSSVTGADDDEFEARNVAAEAKYKALLPALSKQLRAGWRAAARGLP